ncbi:hypothetical protein RFI_24904, partial [Reticulomyxa filosa]
MYICIYVYELCVCEIIQQAEVHRTSPTNIITWRNENELFTASDDNTIVHVDIRKISDRKQNESKEPWVIHRFDGKARNLGWMKNVEVVSDQYIMSFSSMNGSRSRFPSTVVLWDVINQQYVQTLLQGCFIRMKYNNIRKQLYLASEGSLVMIDDWDLQPFFLQAKTRPRVIPPCMYDEDAFGMPCARRRSTSSPDPVDSRSCFLAFPKDCFNSGMQGNRNCLEVLEYANVCRNSLQVSIL